MPSGLLFKKIKMYNFLKLGNMDLFEKIDELRAKDVTPEEFEEVNGVSQEEAMRKVTEFVDRFRKAKAARNNKKIVRLVAEPKAAAAIELDPAATPAAAVTPATAERAASGKKRSLAAMPVEELTAKILAHLKASGIEVPKRLQSERAARTLGDIIKFEIKDGIVTVKPNEEIRKKGIVIQAKELEGLLKFKREIRGLVEPVKGLEGIGISGIDLRGVELFDAPQGKGRPAGKRSVKGPKGGGGPK